MKVISFLFFMVMASGIYSQTGEDLIAWYPFSGNALDLSGNDHHGSVVGPALVPDRFGNPEEAYQFDGIDDYILVLDEPSLRLSNQDYTIALWVRFLSSGGADPESAAMVSKRSDYNFNEGYLYQRIGMDNPIVPDIGKINYIVSGGNSPLINSTVSIGGGEWHHIALTYDLDSQTGKLYVDGGLEGEGMLFSPKFSNYSDLFFGKDGLTGKFYLNGILDDIRIYGKSLTIDEIREIMEYNPISSVSEAKDAGFDILVYPNPSNGLVSFMHEIPLEIVSVRVFDSTGRMWYEGAFKYILDLSAVGASLVYIEFLDENKTVLARKEVIIERK